MEGKILAVFLLFIGGGITLYILYKILYGIFEPLVTKKIEQQMTKDKLSQLQNNLTLHQQVDQKAVEENKKNMKK